MKWLLLISIFFAIGISGCSRLPDIPDREPMHRGKRSALENAGGEEDLSQRMRHAIEEASTLAGSSGKNEDLWKGPLELKGSGQALESQIKTRTAIMTKDSDYLLGPEDIISVTVWNHGDLSRKLQISREGEFFFPLIGKIRAEGMTAARLEKEIANLLADGYLRNPQVNVYIENYRSNKVFVLGEIENAGIYPLSGKTSLLEILSRAGGPTEAATEVIMVIRPRNPRGIKGPIPLNQAKEGEVIKIDLNALQDGDMTHNIEIKNRDTIYIPEAKFFFVFGEVASPGQYKLDEGTTVIKAISMAHGLTGKAAVNRTRILREKEGMRIVIDARMNDLIQFHDIIMIPESFF